MILQPDSTMNTNKQELLDIINAVLTIGNITEIRSVTTVETTSRIKATVKCFRGDEPLTAEATLDSENLEDEWTVTH